jgi:NAD(P)-dependent dehydrogenase (short-subunit alcohol dehydrogenase family)
MTTHNDSAPTYSEADQPKRCAQAKADQNQRVLQIESVYEPAYLAGKVVLVTGGNRGLGKAIAQECARQGAQVIVTVRKVTELPFAQSVVDGIDVTDNDAGVVLAERLQALNLKVDILINNAGYFAEAPETLETLNFDEALKMIDICALGPLRITGTLVNKGCLASSAKVAMITSQGGSIAWRFTQNPQGGDYGHHMSKAAANMMGVLLAQELKGQDITVVMLHPGFNKTDMTQKYAEIWAEEGAVAPEVGAKRVLHEIGRVTADNTGQFINCEDGLLIPW